MNETPSRLAEALADRYTLLHPIGEGGMATVYLADDLRHERQVALKVLKPELAAVVGAERFLSEIKTTAGLQHPHILPLFDSGQADSFLYYVMPYIEGETLRDRIDREHQLPVGDAVAIGRAVASALQVAHDRGIVHRDIKPGNILMSRGEPLVADFGIALAVGTAGGSRLTETGLSVGTPYYMSPEQATGDREVGPASDIYALAAVVYEMLAGEPPYPGTTAQAVLGKIIQGAPVSAVKARPTVPRNVDAAIRKGLERLPADRFTRADEFERALADPGFRWRDDDEPGSSAGAGLWKGVALGTGVLAASLAGVVAFGALSSPPEKAPEYFSLRPLEGQERNHNFDLSDDGTVYVMAVNEGDAGGLRARRLGDPEPVAVPGTQEATFPAVSSDGTEVAFVQGGELKATPIAGGVVRTLADSAFCCVSWERDGNVYFNNARRVIRRVPGAGGAVEPVTEPREDDDGPHGGLSVHPDGRTVVFNTFVSPGRIEALNLETGERRIVAPGRRAFFTPDGDLLIAAAQGTLLAANFDPETLEVEGTPVPILEGIQVPSTDWPNVQFSPAGDLLYWRGPATSGAQVRVVRIDREGVATPIDDDWIVNAGQSNERALSLSPDGRSLAVKHVSDAGEDIWIKQLPDGPFSRLTFDPERDWRPWWSPDGQWVYFLSWRGGNLDLYRRRADGTGQAELILDQEVHVAEAMLTPEGDGLVVRLGGSVGGVNNRDIARYTLADGRMEPLVAESYDEKEATLSPDGRWLAYTSQETGRDEVYIRPYPDVDGGKWQVTTGGGMNPRWAPSGEEIFFIDATNDMASARLRLDSGVEVVSTRELFNAGELGTSFAGNYAGWAVDADGESVIMMQSMATGGADVEPEFILIRNLLGQVRERLSRR